MKTRAATSLGQASKTMSSKSKRQSHVREIPTAYTTESKVKTAKPEIIRVEVNQQGQLFLSEGQKTTTAAQWLLDACGGIIDRSYRKIGSDFWKLSSFAGMLGSRKRSLEIRVVNLDTQNTIGARLTFARQFCFLISAIVSNFDESALIAADLPAARQRWSVTAGRNFAFFFPLYEKACKAELFPITVDLEGVSDEEHQVTPQVIGVTSEAFAVAVNDPSLSETLSSLRWDQLALLRSCLEEAEQLKAAEELLDGKQFTVNNINRILANTDRSFTNHEKENLVRVVRYFESRDKQLHVDEGKKTLPCRITVQPRSNAATLMFDIDARREGGRRIMRSSLPEGLTIS